MASVAIGGIASFYSNGVLYELAGSIKIDVGGVIRTPAVGPGGVTGKWTEKNDPPMMEVELFDDPALSLQALRATVNASIQAQLNSGKSYVLHGAFQVGKLELDAIAGKFTFSASGTDMLENTVSS